MAPLYQFFGRCAVLGLALISTAQSHPTTSEKQHVSRQTGLRLMPLGASITFGQGSSDGNGYRSDLRDLLRGDGYTVDMIGTQEGGTMDDPDNEGYPGARVEQVDGYEQSLMASLNPNLITINLGTNDCSQNFDLPNVGSRMNDLLNFIYTTLPDVTVILSTLIINLDAATETNVENANSQYNTVASQQQQQGRKLILVDMHSDAGPQSGDMSDATHPNDAGYTKMAAIWHQGIQDAAAAGWIV